jgi:hypothetical protein
MVRSLRILAGIVLLCVAYSCAAWGWPAVDKPLAALTLGDLFALVAGLAIAATLSTWALAAAFGAGPVEASPDVDALARRNVLADWQAQAEEAARAEAERAQLARWYRLGNLVGRFFDPSIARKLRWRPFVAVLVAFAILGLVDYLANHVDP